MYRLEVDAHFDAAHFLPWHTGKCQREHGHRWVVTARVQARRLNENGIVMDFAVVKEALKEVLKPYDHYKLNDFMENPTAELIARDICYALALLIPIHSVKVAETPGCSVTYYYKEEE